MLMRRMLWDGIRLSADLGDGGGGAVDGGAVADAAPAVDAGVDAGAAQEAQPFDFDGLAKEFGGPDGLKQAAMYAKDIHMRSNYNPQFKQTLEKALNGDYGAEAQQQAQQQQGQQQPAAPKADTAALQRFHEQYQQARQLNDPEAMRDFLNDPMNAKAKEAYFGHADQQAKDWYSPGEAWQRHWNSPEMQQARQQEFQQSVEPMVQQMNHQIKSLWYQNNQKAVDTLPEDVKNAFMNGYYGAGPDAPFSEWLPAVQAAIQDAQKRAAQGVQPAQNASGSRNVETPAQPQRNGQKQPTNAGGDSLSEASRKFAKDLGKARLSEKS